jgi:hypothetical protein
MKKRSLKKTNKTLEIGDKIGIVINFNYFHHIQNPKSDSKCKDIIKEMSNQQIEKIIKSKILKIINEWISDLNYGNITNKTVNINIPSVRLNIKPSDIKKIKFVKINNSTDSTDIKLDEECIYYNSKQVMILLVTELISNKKLNYNNLSKHYDLPNLKTVNKINDNPKKYFSIVRNSMYHYSRRSGILDKDEKNNLLFDKILFKVLKTNKSY